jgi:hypothetical protein
MAKARPGIDKGKGGACLRDRKLGERRAVPLEPGNRRLQIIDEQRRVMQALFARPVREHVVEGRWVGIVLHHQLHHHAAPLAVCAGVIKWPFHPAMLRGREGHVPQHDKRP